MNAAITYLHTHGFDLCQPLNVHRYNTLIEGRVEPLSGRNGLVVGNTKALWPAFMTALQSDAELAADAHPLDRYTAQVMHAASALIPSSTEVRLGHIGGHQRISMLDLAHASGLAHRGPAYLAVHPEHGPWIGLRGVILIDTETPEEPVPYDPCTACSAPCVDAMHEALTQSNWPAWLVVRDVCPVGQSSRYSEAQIQYHYGKNKAALQAIRVN